MSPDRYARMAGLLYLLLTVVGPFSMMFVPSAVVVPGDAAATAGNVAASASLVRLGLLGDAIIFLAEVPLVVLLYLLFEPVSRAASLVAVVVAVGAMAGEIPFMLWLLIRGVDLEAWRARAAAAARTAG